MTPETAMTEIGRGLEMALVLGAPPLLAVLAALGQQQGRRPVCERLGRAQQKTS